MNYCGSRRRELFEDGLEVEVGVSVGIMLGIGEGVGVGVKLGVGEGVGVGVGSGVVMTGKSGPQGCTGSGSFQ